MQIFCSRNVFFGFVLQIVGFFRFFHKQSRGAIATKQNLKVTLKSSEMAFSRMVCGRSEMTRDRTRNTSVDDVFGRRRRPIPTFTLNETARIPAASDAKQWPR